MNFFDILLLFLISLWILKYYQNKQYFDVLKKFEYYDEHGKKIKWFVNKLTNYLYQRDNKTKIQLGGIMKIIKKVLVNVLVV